MRIPQLLTTLIAAGTLLAGCYKQPDLVPPVADRDQTLTLRAVLEDGAQTKVDISSATGAATWTDGDQVAYCITDGSSTRYNTSPVDVGTGRISLSLPAGYRRTGLAFYPAAARGTDPADPTAPAVHYPDTYDLSGKNAETWAPCPMIALNTESELHFYHVGGLLRLHLGAIPGGTRSLRLTFRGVDYVTGTFAVSGAGTTAAACTKAGTDGGNVLTFTNGSTDFPASTFLNVPLPGLDYTDLKEILIHCQAADGASLCTLEKYVSGGTTIDRAEGLMVHLGAGNRKMHDFSVAAGRKVLFSPGNLQATTTDLGASWTWAFAANQWDYIGNAAGNNSINGVGTVSTNGTVDLFGWNGKSSSNGSYGINNSTSDANYGNNASDVLKTDWGSIPEVISTLGAGWRTLSNAEWGYLFDTRTTTSGVRYAKATVNGVTGIILLPDDWSASYYALASTNTAGAAYTANTISLSDWTSKLEAHGAVFLPAAGYRENGTIINSVGVFGIYWSSTAFSTTNAYSLTFSSSGVTPQGNTRRHDGFSVRLVRDANPFLFSISDSAKAEFSPGNLQYQASTDTWRFAEHQWDYIGAANASISSNYSGWIDLFGWGTSGHKFGSGYGSAYQPWSTSTTGTHYGPTDGTSGLTGTYALGDWGVKNAIGSYPAGTWRAPTRAEWVYLFDTRTTASGIRYAKATVNGVSGIILLPDDWSASYYTLASTNTAGAAYTVNQISESVWNASFEPHGAVFLPAAGYRVGAAVRYVGSIVFYWSSTLHSTTYVYSVRFGSDSVDDPQNPNDRYYGFSVRLLR